MINLQVSLSQESILRTARRIQDALTNLQQGIADTIDILVNEGAEVAQSSYGDFGVEAVPNAERTRGTIDVIGDMPLIAEFGAGETTLNPAVMFENLPDTEVFRGSYSLLEGSKEFATTGVWHFGGEEYSYVEPHMGLFNAKNYIIQESTDTALEAIQL